MRVLLSAATASISRSTPHTISSSVWALSKLAGAGSGISLPQERADGHPAGADCSGAPAAGSFPAAAGDLPLGSSRDYSGGAYAASDTGASTSGDEGLGLGESSGEAILRPVAPVGAARQSTAAGIAQLLQGLAGATQQRAAEFKPAHIGDALWGFGSLGIHPGNGALGGLLDAAASAGASGFKGSNAACALVGLGRLVTAHPHALLAQHVMPLSPGSVLGLDIGLAAGLTAEGGAAAGAGGSVDGGDVNTAAAPAVPVPVPREMREHPGLTLLAEVAGTAAPSLAPDRLSEVIPSSEIPENSRACQTQSRGKFSACPQQCPQQGMCASHEPRCKWSILASSMPRGTYPPGLQP